MNFVIRTKNVLSEEDILLDMELELWELEYELGMPMWYWVTDKLRNHQVAKARVLKNKIRQIENRLNKSTEYD